MRKHTTLNGIFDVLINSEMATPFLELVIGDSTYFGIILADKTAIVPFGDYYELYSPDEYEIKK